MQQIMKEEVKLPRPLSLTNVVLLSSSGSIEEHDEKKNDSEEPILAENIHRFCLFPIQYPDIWQAYKNHKKAFWTAEEIDFVADKSDWDFKLNQDERFFLEHILAFFAGSDGIVLENLVQNFCQEVTIPEARCFYAFQAAMENIHCVTGDTWIQTQKGHVPIVSVVNQFVDVWNGKQYSSVKILYTGKRHIFRVEFSNGMDLSCSREHFFYVRTLNGVLLKKRTCDLQEGDHIAPFFYPEDEISTELVPFKKVSCPDYHQAKYFALCMSRYGYGYSIMDDRKTVHLFQDSNQMTQKLYVRRIIDTGKIRPTYCFEEPFEHKGIFNGILTGQSETYSMMIDTYIQNHDRKKELFQAIDRIPCIQKKAQWALRWISRENSFAKRLFAFGIVEGVFFSGAFCAIFWLKERGYMTRSLGKSNEWIARDESLHTEFAVLLYKHLNHKISVQEAHRIIHEAVEIEQEFICESLPVRLIGMNQDLMRDYIRFVADRLLVQFGYSKLYFSKNPFPFMEKLSLEGKTNFFEQRVSEYTFAVNTHEHSTWNLSHLENDDF